ncbi:MAG TPA: hypothetical protein VL625_09725 [Patescibacteria group bacterium]|nr:hypothetical protein [Patescibacteria group bacterium]
MTKAGWVAAAFAGVVIAGAGFEAGTHRDAILQDAVDHGNGVEAAVALRVLHANPNAKEGFQLAFAEFTHNTFLVKQFIAAGYDLNNRGACPALDSALVIDPEIADVLLDAGFPTHTGDCTVLPRIADGWYNNEHGIYDSRLLKKVLDQGQFSQAELDEAMASAATFNRNTYALTVLKEAGANPDHALQLNTREFLSPEAVLNLINRAGANPQADNGKALKEAETTLQGMRERQAKDPSLMFPDSERRSLQIIQILNAPSNTPSF